MRRLLIAILSCAVLALSGVVREPAKSAARAYRSPVAAKRLLLSVVTYNIHVGIGMDKKLDLARIAKVIKDESPNLVSLQEVDRGVERTGRRDEIAELARLLKMEYAFAPNLSFQGGWYGVAILSRFPILTVDHRRFAHLREGERRGFLRVEVEVEGRRVHFVTTHLDYQHEDNRLYETEQLLRALETLEGALVVTGDFNDEPQSKTWLLMMSHGYADAWAKSMGPSADAVAPGGSGLTYPADIPKKRIDYIFYRDNGTLAARGAAVRVTLASDHRPLSALLEIVK
jgi:endonuclease/exonuclease/phosphatase family metal-dependent hydrolase